MSRSSSRDRKSLLERNRARLFVEALEDRTVPTTITNTISGFVYYDANGNGLMDAGEQPIANSSIQLQNSTGTVIGSTTTDAHGFYQFTNDQSNLSVDGTVTKTVTFPSTDTNFSLNGVLDQFDPSLGQLQSVEIQHSGSITSEIKVENLSDTSTSHITGNVSGTLNLVAPGVNDNLTITGAAGSFDAAQFDGSNDFSGASGTTFGQKTANGSNTIMVTDPTALAAYTGTGTLNVAENADATSNATGGGNLEVNVKSTGEATITVIYHYKTAGPLQPGTYKVVQTVEPTGYTDGLESQQGTVIPGTIGTDFINVTIPAAGGTSTDNDFGELKLTGISGHVYFDANNNGTMDTGESGIGGVTMTLTGGAAPVTTTTAADGSYSFTNLQPGTYTVAETQPAGYLNGTDTAGSKQGTVHNVPGDENINSIVLASGDNAVNYDFGELKSSSLAGFVYFDANDNGTFDAGESPIPGTTVTLTGFDDAGPVNQTATTDATGAYSFANLRPGTYAITETQPAGYLDGKDTIGTPGGTTNNDSFTNVLLNSGVDGVNNNFGELKADVPGNPLPKDVPGWATLPGFSKAQFTTSPSWANINPAFRSQLAFVVGTTVTLTGQQLGSIDALTGVQTVSTAGAGAFINQVWSSDAHRAAQVTSAYESVLNRAPTSQELTTGISQLNGGGDQLTMLQDLYTSQEFQNMHPTSAGLANALSQGILNTTPGTASTQALLQSMGTEPLSQVVHDLLTSDASLSNQIDNAYLQILRRHPSAAEVQFYSPQVAAGTLSLDALGQQLLNSQEFYQLALANVT